MPDFTRLPWIRSLSPFRRGLADALLSIAIPALSFSLVLFLLAPEPSAALLGDLAQIGATLLVAYAVVAAWIAKAALGQSAEVRDGRLGAFLGVGAAGLAGIALALGLSERIVAGHWTWIDELALGWICASLLVFGIFVVMQPWTVHEWAAEDPSE